MGNPRLTTTKHAAPPAAPEPRAIHRLSDLDRLRLARQVLQKTGYRTLAPTLGLYLNLERKPFSLRDHFPFEAAFATHMPQRSLVKAGRQIGKTQNLQAARACIQSILIPDFSTLFITPLFEQIKRLSNNYVRPLIEQSPIRHMIVDQGSDHNILQRSFANGSDLHFSFCYLTADRTRGFAIKNLSIDEIQDIAVDHLDVLRFTMSHYPEWSIENHSGTPKTTDILIERLWQESSQAEFSIRCDHCNQWNYPAMNQHLDKMFGKFRKTISEDSPGICCAYCGRPVNPRRHGRWIHMFSERRHTFAGYHMPQMIFPHHYASPAAWRTLLRYQKTMTPRRFYNECCGESYDLAAKLITPTDLKRAAHGVGPNILEDPEDRLRPEKDRVGAVWRCRRYNEVVLAIDWGGGGSVKSKNNPLGGESFTAYAAIGRKPNGQMEVFYGHRSMTPHDHIRELFIAKDLAERLGAKAIVHDYAVAGHVRDTLLLQAMPSANIVRIVYSRLGSGAIMKFNQPNVNMGETHGYYVVDKSRSLALVCGSIRAQILRTFDYDHLSKEEPGLLHDFMALIEDRLQPRFGSEIPSIIRDPNLPDDFAQAVNMGCCAIWYSTDSWPNLAAASRFTFTSDFLAMLAPDSVYQDWEQEDLLRY